VALKGGGPPPHFLGVQTLKSAEWHRPGLRQAGWKSGIEEAWAPNELAQSGRPYDANLTIDLTIDQFGSSAEAAAYQAKAISRFEKEKNDGVASHFVPMRRPDVPGAVVDQSKGSGFSYTLVFFHRGAYEVSLGGGKRNTSVDVERLVEHMAQTQFARLPH
jgi:hypothetical protein